MQKIFFGLIILNNFLFCGDIFLEVENINQECKILKIGLYNSKDGFPNIAKAYKGVDIKAKSPKITHTFTEIPNGSYALALFCDENQNKKLDTNFVGIPKEAYGFSNNPKVFGMPSFEDARFELKDKINLNIEVQK